MQNWRAKNCNVYVCESLDNGKVRPATGKFFAVAGNRTEGWQGMEQDITGRIEESMHYNISGQVRIRGNAAEANVMATLYMKGMDGKDQYHTLAKYVSSCLSSISVVSLQPHQESRFMLVFVNPLARVYHICSHLFLTSRIIRAPAYSHSQIIVS